MTIYKPRPGEKKVEKKSDVSQSKVKIPEDATPLASKKKADASISFVMVPMVRQRRRGYFVVFTASFVLMMILFVAIGSVYLYKFVKTKRICSKTATFRYYEFEKLSNGNGIGTRRRTDGTFTEDIEMDIESGVYERISVPPILESRRSTVLHDFETNWTAIADHDKRRCFVMPLNRKAISPPKSFADLLEKYDAGYYLPDAELVRADYKVQLPAVHDLVRFGIYIAYDCRFYDTYQLVRDDFSRVKRSACEMEGDSYCLGDTGSDEMLCIKLSGCM